VCGVTYLGVWGRFCSGRCTNKGWKERRRDDYLAIRPAPADSRRTPPDLG